MADTRMPARGPQAKVGSDGWSGAEDLANVFEQNADRIYRLVVGLVRDEDEAEDVVQDTFVRLMTASGSFEGRSAIGTWLYRVAYNAAIDRLRARNRHIMSDCEEAEAEDAEPFMPSRFQAWSLSPDEILSDKEARRHLDEAIEGLSPGNRAVFLLRDVEELTTANTSETIGISESAVRVRLHRARLQLRETLTEYFTECAEEEVGDGV